MKKRKLFSELAEGFDALANERAGDLILRKHELQVLLASDMPSNDQTSSPMSSLLNIRN